MDPRLDLLMKVNAILLGINLGVLGLLTYTLWKEWKQ